MRYIRARFSQMKTWQRRLVIVIAVLVIIALAGSLIVERLYLRQRGGSETFQLRRGWTQMATYNGTGTKTITGLHLDLPFLWGYAFACEGKSVTGEIDGTNLAGQPSRIAIDASPCSASSSSNLAPEFISLLYTVHVQTIRLTASSTTRWRLQFEKAVNQPAAPSMTEWVSDMGMGDQIPAGERNGSSAAHLLPLTEPNGRTIVPRTYAIAFVCFGRGIGTVTLTPGSGAINTLNCDGHVKYVLIRYPAATQLESIQVSITSAASDTIWYTTLLGCADESKCGALPVTAIPTVR